MAAKSLPPLISHTLNSNPNFYFLIVVFHGVLEAIRAPDLAGVSHQKSLWTHSAFFNSLF